MYNATIGLSHPSTRPTASFAPHVTVNRSSVVTIEKDVPLRTAALLGRGVHQAPRPTGDWNTCRKHCCLLGNSLLVYATHSNLCCAKGECHETHRCRPRRDGERTAGGGRCRECRSRHDLR
ncbi:MAG: hypothetical protein GEV09_14480 [Pseudonocardiaceae bacterium]|nr:hypothetical protein [Pseudonocardiaceae bacterium]